MFGSTVEPKKAPYYLFDHSFYSDENLKNLSPNIGRVMGDYALQI